MPFNIPRHCPFPSHSQLAVVWGCWQCDSYRGPLGAAQATWEASLSQAWTKFWINVTGVIVWRGAEHGDTMQKSPVMLWSWCLRLVGHILFLTADSCLDRVTLPAWCSCHRSMEFKDLRLLLPTAKIKLKFESLCLSCCNCIDLIVNISVLQDCNRTPLSKI